MIIKNNLECPSIAQIGWCDSAGDCIVEMCCSVNAVAEGIREDGEDDVYIECELSCFEDCQHEENPNEAHNRTDDGNEIAKSYPPCFVGAIVVVL